MPSAARKLKPVSRGLRLVQGAELLTVRQQATLVERTGSLARAMRDRIREKTPDFELPFDLAELRQHVIRFIGQPCCYCKCKLTPANFSLDHILPVSRGGGSGLVNLSVVCKSCNTAKGELTAEEFSKIYNVLGEFDPVVAADVIGRLKAGAAAKRLRFLRH